MNRVALQTFSYFDTGNRPSEKEPERFYHGFVLGLIVELTGRYLITSNREIGKGERVNGPIIELPNGLKVGDYVDYSKIVETYGMPAEENTTGQDYEYGTEYVYRSEDGTKVFRVYTASNRLIGFRMWVDSKTYDWYTH